MTTIAILPSPVLYMLIVTLIVIKTRAPLPRKRSLIALCTGLLIVSGLLVALDVANWSARRSEYGSLLPDHYDGQIDAGTELVRACGNEFVRVRILMLSSDWIEMFFRDMHVPDVVYSYANVTGPIVLNFTPPYSSTTPLLLASWVVVMSNVNSNVTKTIAIVVFYSHLVPLIHSYQYSWLYCGLVSLSICMTGLLIKKKKVQTTEVQTEISSNLQSETSQISWENKKQTSLRCNCHHDATSCRIFSVVYSNQDSSQYSDYS